MTLKAAKFSGTGYEGIKMENAQKQLKGHVLVAEDNRMNQLVIQEMLVNLGCTLEIVHNGNEALATLRQKNFDLILMDGQMPEMDGYEVSRRIRKGEAGKENLTIPIVATTANAIKGDIEKCMMSGMNDYVAKPISYEDLALKIEKWLERGRDVIDRATLKRIDDLGARGKTDLRGELLQIFAEERQTLLPRLREQLSQDDYLGISRIAHSLKSASANLGAMRVRDVAERLEKAKTDPSNEHVAWLIDSLQNEFDLALTELALIPKAASTAS